jgi:hypothetical protein
VVPGTWRGYLRVSFRTDSPLRSALFDLRSLIASLAVLFLMGSSCEGNPVFVVDPLEGPDPDETAVLFIGNSITLWFGMTGQFEALADSAGRKTWIVDLSKLGHYLEDHLESAATDVKITEWDWDYVVLQDGHPAVAFPEYHYLIEPEFLHCRDLALSDNPDCGIVMQMDYAREQESHLDTLFTFSDMQQRITAGTILFADRHDMMIAPFGTAFDSVYRERPELDRYDTDRSHPSAPMQYLQACIYYAVIFQESPVGNPFHGTIEPELAIWLQQLAARTVLTDRERWNLPDVP